MNEQIEFEKKMQANYWFTYRAANIAAVGFVMILAYNGHDAFSMLCIMALIGFNAWRVPMLQEQFDERLKYVTFKTEVKNLYVVSEFEGQPDATAAATFYATLQYLKTVGNEHELRVHLMMFRDVNIFTWFWDANGRLQKQVKSRPSMSSAETWDEYLQAVDLFKKTDHDEWLRRIRKDAAGFDWVNANIFGQWQQSEN